MFDKIDNIESLTNFFGYTPNFHDAEILMVTLDRNGCNSLLTKMRSLHGLSILVASQKESLP